MDTVILKPYSKLQFKAENTGKLMQFSVEEGQILEKTRLVGFIDTIPLHLTEQL